MKAACINPLHEPPRADRILVIRLGALGDVLRTLPAFASLRALYPDAHLAWLVEPGSEAAVRGQPGVDEVFVFPREELEAGLAEGRYPGVGRRALRFARSLRQASFDLVVDFHAILKSGLLARATGAPVRITYAAPFAREGAGFWASHRARIEPAELSRYERNAALVSFLSGSAPSGPFETRFHVDPDERSRMQRLLADLHDSTPLALLHPGSSAGTPYKRYPVAAWGEVARGLARRGVSCRVVAGSEAEARIARDIVSASGGAAPRAPETRSVPELAALLEAADLFLGNDSGPLHLASLVGTPVVQLLGPTHPVENAPWPGVPSRSLRVPVGCAPCRRGCAPAPCMQTLPPTTVVEAALSLLAEGPLAVQPPVEVRA